MRVTSDELQFGYSSFLSRKATPRAAIVKAEPIERVNGLTEYGGWGIRLRLNFSGETGYIAKNGPAVRVILRKGRQGSRTCTYVFNCDQPKTVCDLLNQNDHSSKDNDSKPLSKASTATNDN